MWFREVVSLSLSIGSCKTDAEVVAVEKQLKQLLDLIPTFQPFLISESRVTGEYVFRDQRFLVEITPGLSVPMHLTVEGGKSEDERHHARLSLTHLLTKDVLFDLTTERYVFS